MTLSAYRRVWEHATERRGTRKLALLALASFADDLGICWPSIPTIAQLITEDPNYVRLLMKDAEAEGDIVRRPGLGRGNPTIYGITIGLGQPERDRLATVVRATAVKRGQRYIEFGDGLMLYTPGCEEQLFTTKEILQTPFSGAGAVENLAEPPPAPSLFPKSRPARRPAQAEPEAIRWLREVEGIATAENFAGGDLDALLADYRARRAENWPKGAIVKYWQTHGPPTKERQYRGQSAEDQHERPGQNSASRSPSRKRAPRPGDYDYDYS